MIQIDKRKVINKQASFYPIPDALHSDNQIQTSQCIHTSDWKASYIAYHKIDHSKMVFKIIDMRNHQQLQKKETKNKTHKYLINLSRYIKLSLGLQNTSKISTNILEIKSLKSDQNVIYLTRPFIEGHSLNNYIMNKDKNFLDQINLMSFINQLISIQTSFQGIRQHVLTSTNIFIDEYFNVSCNFASMVGIGFIQANQVITKQEFYQIYPYLYSNILKQEKLKRNNVYFKIRGIVVNLLKLILKYQFQLLENILLENVVSPTYNNIQKITLQLKDHFKKFLKKKQVKNAISSAQKKFDLQSQRNHKMKKVEIMKLFKQILVQQKIFDNYQQFMNQYFYKIKQDKNYFNCFKYYEICVQKENSLKKKFLLDKGLLTPLFYFPIKWNIEIKSYINKNVSWYNQIIQKRNGSIIQKYAFQIDKLAYCFLSNTDKLIKLILNSQRQMNQYYQLKAFSKEKRENILLPKKQIQQQTKVSKNYEKQKQTQYQKFKQKKEFIYIITWKEYQKVQQLQQFYKIGLQYVQETKIINKFTQNQHINELLYVDSINKALK